MRETDISCVRCFAPGPVYPAPGRLAFSDPNRAGYRRRRSDHQVISIRAERAHHSSLLLVPLLCTAAAVLVLLAMSLLPLLAQL